MNIKSLKTWTKNTFSNTTWVIANALIPMLSGKPKSNKMLVIPAADLTGGFGEDIMLASFLSEFANGRDVTIYTYHQVIRNDYLKIYPKLTFKAGFTETLNYIKVVRLLSQFAGVYVIGADIMDGTYGLFLPINRIRTLELANKLSIKVQISGFSVSNKTLQVVKEEFTKASQFLTFKARDIESYKRMNQYIKTDRLVLTNDIAFICPDIPDTYASEQFSAYQKWASNAKANGKYVVAICPNSIQAKKVGVEKYIADFISLIEIFAKNTPCAFAYLYHDLRPLCDIYDDGLISDRLYKHFSNTDIESYFTPDIKNGVEVKGYISEADFTVTGRMHFGISGITYGRPMFGITYANKFEGMVKLFDIKPEYCLTSYEDMGIASDTVKTFLQNLEGMKNSINENLNKVKNDTLKNFEA